MERAMWMAGMWRLVPAVIAGMAAAAAASADVDLLASTGAGELKARARRVFRQTFELRYRAEEHPVLELGLESDELVSVEGRILRNDREEAAAPAGAGLVAPAPPEEPAWLRGAGRASFRRRVVPGEAASVWIDLRHANVDLPFDGYRGWIQTLALVLDRPASDVRIVRARLHGPSGRVRRAALREVLRDPGRVHPNFFVLAGVIPLALLIRMSRRPLREAVVAALLLAWLLGAVAVGLRRLEAAPALVEALLTVPPDRVGDLRSGGGRTRRTAAALRRILPERTEVGYFGQSVDYECNALQLELPLWSFMPRHSGLPFLVHAGTSQLPVLAQEAGPPRWASVARGQPLAQTFGVPAPVEAVALQLTLEREPPEGAELAARVWRGGGKHELVSAGSFEPGGPFRLRPALRLCPGETYLLELKLFGSPSPVRVLAAGDDPYPGGAARGGGIGDGTTDLRWRFYLSPSGAFFIGDGGEESFVFRQGTLEPCGSSPSP